MNIGAYRKQIVWGIAAAALLLVISTLVYSLFFRDPKTDSTDPGAFPSGDGRTIVPPGANNGSAQNGSSSDAPQALFQMHDRAVISSVMFLRGNEPYARFMEQGSGHVYEYDLKNKRSYRISNTSVPQIQEALWAQNGNVVAFRYEDGGILKAAVGELSTTTEERSFVNVYFLPEGIRGLALSPDGAQVFYIIPGATAGTASGIVARRDGSSPRTVFNGKLPRWLASWPTATSIVVSSPWSTQGGIAYRINPQTGAQSILYTTQGLFLGIGGGPAGELLVADPNTKRLGSLRNSSVEPELAVSWPSLCAFASHATSTVVCAYIPQAGYDLALAWERGEYDFASNIMLLELNNGSGRFLLSNEEMGDRVFDAIHPALSPDASFASFTNRVDGLLWGVVLE